jgi:membrane protease YdiL (CAAX protease family)
MYLPFLGVSKMKKVIATLLFFIMIIAIQIPTLGEILWHDESRSNINYLNHFLVSFGVFLVLLIVLWLIYKSLGGEINISSWSSKSIIIAVSGALISQLIQYIISYTAQQSTTDPDIFKALHSSLGPITVITTLVLSPILEEFLFQGILQAGILKNLSPVFSILLTAAIFAIIHGFGFNAGTLALFASGLAYATVFWYTADLKMAILCHGMSNLIVIILLLL